MRLVFTNLARKDLRDIAAYIRRDAPVRAQTFVMELRNRCVQLTEYPASGVLRDDLPADVRVLTHGPYLIVYTALPDAIRIVRVLHGARDVGEDDLA